MANVVSGKLRSGNRGMLACCVAVAVMGAISASVHMKNEHERDARARLFCSIHRLDAASCQNTMAANRRSWGE